MHELSLPEPMLSLNMLILATCPEPSQECSEHCSARSARSERLWTPRTTFGANTEAITGECCAVDQSLRSLRARASPGSKSLASQVLIAFQHRVLPHIPPMYGVGIRLPDLAGQLAKSGIQDSHGDPDLGDSQWHNQSKSSA